MKTLKMKILIIAFFALSFLCSAHFSVGQDYLFKDVATGEVQDVTRFNARLLQQIVEKHKSGYAFVEVKDAAIDTVISGEKQVVNFQRSITASQKGTIIKTIEQENVKNKDVMYMEQGADSPKTQAQYLAEVLEIVAKKQKGVFSVVTIEDTLVDEKKEGNKQVLIYTRTVGAAKQGQVINSLMGEASLVEIHTGSNE